MRETTRNHRHCKSNQKSLEIMGNHKKSEKSQKLELWKEITKITRKQTKNPQITENHQKIMGKLVKMVKNRTFFCMKIKDFFAVWEIVFPKSGKPLSRNHVCEKWQQITRNHKNSSGIMRIERKYERSQETTEIMRNKRKSHDE